MTFNSLLNKAHNITTHGSKLNFVNDIIKVGLNNNLINKLKILNSENYKIYNFRTISLDILFNLKNPDWVYIECPDINYDNIIYYSHPKLDKVKLDSLLKYLDVLNIGTLGVNNNALDIIFDSISVINTIQPFLKKFGIIFVSLFDAIKLYFYIVNRYLNTVVSIKDNLYATLNSVIFSEGSFCYIPKDIKCYFTLSTYFRTNTKNFAQFERTLIICNDNSVVSYLEGCTAPMYKESQLHVAIVEIIVKSFGYVKYFTIQNWYKGNILGEGGVYNFTTKRGVCYNNAVLDWVQLEIGSMYTWKYPSSFLIGDYSISNFFSISFISDFQVADTGGKIFHKGNFTTSKIVSKSISLNSSVNVYRGLIFIDKKAFGCRNQTECDSLLFNDKSLVVTIPYSIIYNYKCKVQQEAFISKIDVSYLYFLMQRGLSMPKCLTLLINGFCADIYNKLPLEFVSEIPELIFTKVHNITL